MPIYKKGDKLDCKNNRTISLVSHASKIVLDTIHQRRKNNKTRDQIMNMMCEKQTEHNKNVYCCFIDYRKAFDCVDFELTWMTLLSVGIPKYLVGVLERPIPKSNCRSRDSSWENGTHFIGASVKAAHFHQFCLTCRPYCELILYYDIIILQQPDIIFMQMVWPSWLRHKTIFRFFCRVLRTIFSHLRAHAFVRSVTVARSSAVQASSSRRQERRWAIVCGSPQSQSTYWASSR